MEMFKDSEKEFEKQKNLFEEEIKAKERGIRTFKRNKKKNSALEKALCVGYRLCRDIW